jgi:hypothetical protein
MLSSLARIMKSEGLTILLSYLGNASFHLMIFASIPIATLALLGSSFLFLLNLPFLFYPFPSQG